MLIPGRYPKGRGPGPDKDVRVMLTHLSVFDFQGSTASLLRTGSDKKTMWLAALSLLRLVMRGRSLPPEAAGALVSGQTRLLTEFLVQPNPVQTLSYEVRFEVEFAIESEMQARTAGRPRQPFPSGERMTYIEQTGGTRSHRRKAFDTMHLSPYAGIHPLDVQSAIAYHPEQRAELAALRLLAARLGRSFLFFDDFFPLALQSAHLKPGAFFLRVLRAWASDDAS